MQIVVRINRAAVSKWNGELHPNEADTSVQMKRKLAFIWNGRQFPNEMDSGVRLIYNLVSDVRWSVVSGTVSQAFRAGFRSCKRYCHCSVLRRSLKHLSIGNEPLYSSSDHQDSWLSGGAGFSSCTAPTQSPMLPEETIWLRISA